MRIVFFGTPDFAVPSLSAILSAGHSVPIVITQPDRPQGRGHKLLPSPVKEFSLSKGLNLIQPQGIRDLSFISEITGLNPEAIVVVAYGKILPPSLLSLPSFGCINVHASLLPKYRGAAPVQRAIMEGEKFTGITTMFMDKGLDTGDILLQERIDIIDSDTTETLLKKLSETGSALLIKTLQEVENRTIKRKPQTGEPSFAPPLSKEDGLISWSFSAKRIFNLIRATQRWPGAYTYLKGERISVLRSSYSGLDHGSAPGTVYAISRDSVDVATGEGILKMFEVKPGGRKAMPATAFAHGKKIREGTRFETP